MRVNVRTLSSNPSRYIQAALRGEEVVVTLRNAPAVRLVPIQEEVPPEEQLRRLGQIPGVKLAKRKPVLPAPVKLTGKGPTASEMVLEDRR